MHSAFKHDHILFQHYMHTLQIHIHAKSDLQLKKQSTHRRTALPPCGYSLQQPITQQLFFQSTDMLAKLHLLLQLLNHDLHSSPCLKKFSIIRLYCSI